MAKRLEKGFIDRRNCIGQPRGDSHNGDKEIELEPALIHYLERIEFDPELEHFYPVDSKGEDCEKQYGLQEMEPSWPGLIPECHVCIHEKTRYPPYNEAMACNTVALRELKDSKENIENAQHGMSDVIQGVETSIKESDKPKKWNTVDGSLFSSKRKQDRKIVTNGKSDFGFLRNFECRKDIIMRESREGSAINMISRMENYDRISKGETKRNERTSNELTTKRRTSRIEIRMMGASKKDGESSNITVNGDFRQLDDLILEKDKSESENEDSNEIVKGAEENRNMVANPSRLAAKCKRDSNEIPVVTMETRGIGISQGISRQTKGNTNGFTRHARQNMINCVKPEEKEPMDASGDGACGNVNNETHIGRTDVEREDTKNRVDTEGNAIEIPRSSRFVSVVNGVEPIFNCRTTNCCDENNKNGRLNKGCLFNEDSISVAADTVYERISSENSNMVHQNGTGAVKACSNVKETSGSGGAIIKQEKIERAVIKSTKSNTADLKGFYIEHQAHKSGITKLPSEAETESIVEISIDGSEEEEDGDGLERNNKWMIAIVDRKKEDENSSLSFSDDSAGDFESERRTDQAIINGYFENCCPDQEQDSAVDKATKTIKSLGNHNPVLENKSLARKSIEKRTSQKCFVKGDFHGDATNGSKSTSGNMWRKPAAVDDAAKIRSADDKSKVIYQGQGVQFRLNVKKVAENQPDKPNEERRGGEKSEGPTKRIVTTAKSVAVKSAVKPGSKVKTTKDDGDKIKKELENIGCNSESIDVEDFGYSEEELLKILNYEPPKLAVPVIGKGHVELDLRKQDLESEDSLKMENARLSKLLLEMEQARATTVKALLSANTVLHKVHDENTKLEGSLKILATDKKFLELELEECKEKLKKSDKEKDFFDVAKATEFESSMEVIINSWRKEKQELLAALAKSSMRVKRVESDAEGLRVGFQRVKDQLENSNESFSKLLEHNLQASVKVEDELRGLRAERTTLLETIEKSSGESANMQLLQEEVQDLKKSLELSGEEKDELCRKITHLEKKNKQFGLECEELQEQLDHSQEILDKLAEKEEELKGRLEKETSEREYLEGCLDETGQILLHLRNSEKKLLDEKDELEEDLEEEIQVNESLQQSLKSTMQQHQSLINRLQDMTTVHITVKESLDEACKKERSYQQQIANLNKTNGILHYSLDKEKEEKIDLQEMYDNLESQWKLFKHERLLEGLDMKKNLEDLAESEAELRLQSEQLVKENGNLRENLEHEEEENVDLRKKLARLEQWKASNETDLDMLRQERDANQNEVSDLKKRVDDLSRGLQKEKDRYENLISTLEDTEESLDKMSKNLSEARDACAKQEKETEEAKACLKEKTKKVRELEIRLGEETGEKERLISRTKSLEKELGRAKKNVEEQREELETNQMHFRRLEREKLHLRKSLDESKREFEVHKERCVENFQKLREELVGVQNKLVEKDRQAMKQKENWQDAIENTAADLKLLRQLLGNEVSYKALKQGDASLREILGREGGEGTDIDVLRKAYHRAESEMMRDVTDLEGMLKISKEQKNTVAIVQSPMSKIKLGEVKKLRDEMYELKNNLAAARSKISEVVEEVIMLKKAEERGDVDNKTVHTRAEEIEEKLDKLDATINKIEADHEYVIEKNSEIINRGIAHVSREHTSDELDSSGESAYEGEDKESLRKEIVVSQLLAENEKLKRNVDFLKKQSGIAASHSEETAQSTGNKRSLRTDRIVAKEDPPLKASGDISAQKYVPPTSMRYPPKYGGASQLSNGSHSGYQSNDSCNSDRLVHETAGRLNVGQSKKPSFFAAEMSLFHHDESVAANILRRKLEGKATLRESKSDTASVRSTDSLRDHSIGRSRRSGSVDDDDDNDEDSDVPIGEFRRSKTLPRKCKSRAVWSKMV